MNAVKFILREHAKIRGTFKRIATLKNEKAKIKHFKDLCNFLVVHETMEQKIWYPFLRQSHAKFRPLIRHLVGEEKAAAKAITKFKKIKVDDTWTQALQTRFVKFKDDVDHHADQEEYDLFPDVVIIVDEKRLQKIGKQLQAFKKKHYR